ncbi:MAG TPA: DUF742 domain-containing protein [Yinghuangia sp.]|uniref:DUF742 domain-containing protein n=1 Tax=Yinghuangia sp. YIM S10712 TaxID=3436930 RepID=UPI002D17BE60|nr:DUF742 domain-containing protein [Yinghuangia sp.]
MSGFEHAWDDDAGPLVRPYTLTRGRTRTSDNLTLITLVTTVDAAPDSRDTALQPEHEEILRLCRSPQAVAEIAALIGLPVSVTRILIGDLVDAGRVTARAPLSMARRPDAELLRKVRDGLGRL